MIVDHNEGIRSNVVLEAHYTDDDRVDLKGPAMMAWSAWLAAQVAATAPPDVATLKGEIACRHREREAAGKAKTAAAKKAVGAVQSEAA